MIVVQLCWTGIGNKNNQFIWPKYLSDPLIMFFVDPIIEALVIRWSPQVANFGQKFDISDPKSLKSSEQTYAIK